MKKNIIFALSLMLGAASASAESYVHTLADIVGVSPSVKAAEAVADAEKAESHTGLTLENPELEASYEWGSPADVPNRTIVSLTQGFDFATLSGAKKRVAEAEGRVADLTLTAAQRATMAEADELMTQAVYRTRLKAFYAEAHELYHAILDATKRAKELGNMNLIDVNTIKIAHHAFKTEARLNDIELEAVLAQLRRLAGGKTFDWSPTDYMDYQLPADFEQWCRQTVGASVEVASANAAVGVADQKLSLSKSEGLPSFSVGYTSELVKDANYFGAALGVELPLWANKGKVKAAKAAKRAAELEAENAAVEYALRQRSLYEKALALKEMETQSRLLRDECDITEGLKKMFSLGELSVHDYLSQLEPLMELDKRVLEAEFDYQSALAAFRAGVSPQTVIGR